MCNTSSGTSGRRYAPTAGGVHASATGPQEPMGGGMLLLQEEFTSVHQALMSQRVVCSCCRWTSRRCNKSSGANGSFAPAAGELLGGAAGPQEPMGGGMLLLQEEFTPVQ